MIVLNGGPASAPRRAAEGPDAKPRSGWTSIGEICAAFALTRRAIRHYEDIGLIEARRDRRNVRVYDAEARERLRWIVLLRRAGVPLPQIARLLESEDGTAAHRRRRALDAVERRIADLQHRLDNAQQVRARLRACAPAGPHTLPHP